MTSAENFIEKHFYPECAELDFRWALLIHCNQPFQATEFDFFIERACVSFHFQPHSIRMVALSASFAFALHTAHYRYNSK